jgi:hypothetical protein
MNINLILIVAKSGFRSAQMSIGLAALLMHRLKHKRPSGIWSKSSATRCPFFDSFGGSLEFPQPMCMIAIAVPTDNQRITTAIRMAPWVETIVDAVNYIALNGSFTPVTSFAQRLLLKCSISRHTV